MALIIGLTLAAAVSALARGTGLDRDRAFYPTVMIVIAALYTLFAVMGGSADALVVEMIVGAGFIILTLAGFKHSLWLVVVALAAHGLFDLVHPHAIDNRGVPVWWPEFCSAYDLAAAGILGWQIHRSKRACG